MDVIKNLKKLKVEHAILFLVGAVFLFYLIKSYSTSKVLGAESMNSRKTQEMFNQSNASQSGGNVEPSQPLGQNETYASATGMSTSTQGLPPLVTYRTLTFFVLVTTWALTLLVTP